MNEETNIKPINEKNEEIKTIELPQQKKENEPSKINTIKNLPEWNIEPPLEIKRGNE